MNLGLSFPVATHSNDISPVLRTVDPVVFRTKALIAERLQLRALIDAGKHTRAQGERYNRVVLLLDPVEKYARFKTEADALVAKGYLSVTDQVALVGIETRMRVEANGGRPWRDGGY